MAAPICPICGRPVEAKDGNPLLPFCSERCRLLDLGEWLGGRRGIPADEPIPEPGPSTPDDSGVRH
jgi:hypothetical protein